MHSAGSSCEQGAVTICTPKCRTHGSKQNICSCPCYSADLTEPRTLSVVLRECPGCLAPPPTRRQCPLSCQQGPLPFWPPGRCLAAGEGVWAGLGGVAGNSLPWPFLGVGA